MEYIDGQTLAQWMADNPEPSLASVRAIVEATRPGPAGPAPARDAAPGPAPGNVMIDGQGTVKLGPHHRPTWPGWTRCTAAPPPTSCPARCSTRPPNTCSARAARSTCSHCRRHLLGGQLPTRLDLARAAPRPMCGGCAASPAPPPARPAGLAGRGAGQGLQADAARRQAVISGSSTTCARAGAAVSQPAPAPADRAQPGACSGRPRPGAGPRRAGAGLPARKKAAELLFTG